MLIAGAAVPFIVARALLREEGEKEEEEEKERNRERERERGGEERRRKRENFSFEYEVSRPCLRWNKVVKKGALGPPPSIEGATWRLLWREGDGGEIGRLRSPRRRPCSVSRAVLCWRRFIAGGFARQILLRAFADEDTPDTLYIKRERRVVSPFLTRFLRLPSSLLHRTIPTD